MTSNNRVAVGVQYSGLTPSYTFFDKTLEEEVAGVVNQFPLNSVRLDSWSEDWSKLLFFMSGANSSGMYFLFDREQEEIEPLAISRENITNEYLGLVQTIEYKSRDGLTIPSILTLPSGHNGDASNLPLIVLPHGGPETYDQVGFDWMAQYFAYQGYAVFQPNFRRSTGFGADFTFAGHGEWGKAMQDDITDGVDALVKMGWVNPDRVCIVGWSYGGYAALAGGALTPEKYKCVVSIAGVSDLPRMLIEERRDHGRDHWVYSLWSNRIGDLRENRDQLEAVSPAYQAEHFQAPVLLIHGQYDLIVPDDQSRRMERALERASKPVKLVIMRKQDHSLSTRNARTEMMREVIAFVDDHIGEPVQN